MRIISGKYRSRQIHPPKQFNARPTTDFAKEGLFNILANQLAFEELDVLDLFAGTGSITYEFASRGARSVVAVELAQSHQRFIQRSCNELGLDQVTVIRGDVFRYLKNPTQSFDLIFADPPYDHPGLAGLPDQIMETNILGQDGLFILEHPAGHSFSAHPRYAEQRKYGGVNFTFFR